MDKTSERSFRSSRTTQYSAVTDYFKDHTKSSHSVYEILPHNNGETLQTDTSVLAMLTKHHTRIRTAQLMHINHQIKDLFNSLVTVRHLPIFLYSHRLLRDIENFESSFGAIHTLLHYWCWYCQINVIVTTLPWNPFAWWNNLAYKSSSCTKQ